MFRSNPVISVPRSAQPSPRASSLMNFNISPRDSTMMIPHVRSIRLSSSGNVEHVKAEDDIKSFFHKGDEIRDPARQQSRSRSLRVNRDISSQVIGCAPLPRRSVSTAREMKIDRDLSPRHSRGKMDFIPEENVVVTSHQMRMENRPSTARRIERDIAIRRSYSPLDTTNAEIPKSQSVKITRSRTPTPAPFGTSVDIPQRQGGQLAPKQEHDTARLIRPSNKQHRHIEPGTTVSSRAPYAQESGSLSSRGERRASVGIKTDTQNNASNLTVNPTGVLPNATANVVRVHDINEKRHNYPRPGQLGRPKSPQGRKIVPEPITAPPFDLRRNSITKYHRKKSIEMNDRDFKPKVSKPPGRRLFAVMTGMEIEIMNDPQPSVPRPAVRRSRSAQPSPSPIPSWMD
eukprot:PhF_6_TR37723/c0_g1_i1/m.56160